MARVVGYRCDACGVFVTDADVEGLPVGWFRLQRKAHACADDYLDVGHFCSAGCAVQYVTRRNEARGSLDAS